MRNILLWSNIKTPTKCWHCQWIKKKKKKSCDAHKRWCGNIHYSGVNIEGRNVFYCEKHSITLVCSQQLSLRWTPLWKEVTECFAVASGSAVWPVASPSGFQTRRSPAGWGCHKLQLWQPPNKETHEMLMNMQYSQPGIIFYLSHKYSDYYFSRDKACYLTVSYICSSLHLNNNIYTVGMKGTGSGRRSIQILHFSKNINTI